METLKFGNGNWATKEGSTLAYNDENNNFKPLPFDFTRASTATYVDSDGLIKTSKQGEARIDYTDSSDGALLLEPARTNLVTHSEDFTNAYWNKFYSSVTSGFVSPDGSTNAFKLIEGNANTQHGLLRSNFPIGVQRTFSVFVKKGENERFFISDYNKFGYTIGVIFNLTSGTVESNQNDSIYLNPKIEPYLNGWYKCSVTWTNTTGLNVPFFGSAISGTNSYQGDGTSGLYVFGAQLEQGSYPTSYIPTNGSTVTRIAETCSNSGNSEVFNDSEGVLFVDIASLADDSSERFLSLSNGLATNRISMWYYSATNGLAVAIYSGNVAQFFTTTVLPKDTLHNKISIKYKENDFALWLNGFEIANDTSGITPVGLKEISFDRGDGALDFYGKTKQVGYYDAVLTDAELETLTSYTSWVSMVNELNLNIIYNG